VNRLRRYKADIARTALGYNIVINAREDDRWVLEMEVGRYWALTRSSAHAKAKRIMRRRRRADTREAAAEVVSDQAPSATGSDALGGAS
jgi:hypothetical protein